MLNFTLNIDLGLLAKRFEVLGIREAAQTVFLLMLLEDVILLLGLLEDVILCPFLLGLGLGLLLR